MRALCGSPGWACRFLVLRQRANYRCPRTESPAQPNSLVREIEASCDPPTNSPKGLRRPGILSNKKAFARCRRETVSNRVLFVHCQGKQECPKQSDESCRDKRRFRAHLPKQTAYQ